jgi:poly-gamma-glutamate capsule biosynthesis protein CapA/YwtB (metallophosphatase superfamily)
VVSVAYDEYMGGQKLLKLLFVGDVMLGRLVNTILKAKPPTYPWGNTLALFREADVRLCNLECVISDRGTPWSATPKVFHFRADAKNVAVLKAARIDAVSLANNHVLDFSYEGLFETLHHLEQAGIRLAGAGATLKEASDPAIWEVQGKKLGFIAITDNEPNWAASGEQPGVWYVPIRVEGKPAQHLFEVVQRTKAEVACLIVSIHWGSNWGYAPPPEHRLFAHALIDHGADIIFGHSSHVVRGIEVYQNRPIIYGAGDFIDDYAVDDVERNDQSFLFMIELNGTTPSRLLLYPTVIRQFQARRAENSERHAIVTHMQRLCTQLNTTMIWNEKEKRLEGDIGKKS